MFTFTTAIIIVTMLTSLAAWQNHDMFDKFKLNPYLVVHQKQYWRMLTCTLLHADFLHLAFNMISLYSLGSAVEGAYNFYFPGLGKVYFMGLYIGGALFSCIGDLYKKKDYPEYNSIGASGAVSAVIFSFVLISPMSMLTVFIFPMPAVIFGVLFLGAEYYLSRRNTQTNINHGAHFEGAVFGIVYTIIFEPRLPLMFLEQIMEAL